jgi:hypothetical protein
MARVFAAARARNARSARPSERSHPLVGARRRRLDTWAALKQINAHLLEPTLVVHETDEAATGFRGDTCRRLHEEEEVAILTAVTLQLTRTRRSWAARTTSAGGDDQRRTREIKIAFGG